MLNLKYIINNFDEVSKKLATRNKDFTEDLNSIKDLAKSRSELMTSLQQKEAERNKLSGEIGKIKSTGGNADDLMKKVADIKQKIETEKIKEQEVNNKISTILLSIPNLPSVDAPLGKNEDENVEIAKHVIGRGLVTNVKPHYEIAIEKDIVDFETAVKLSGSRFWAYKNLGSKLLRALKDFMLDVHTENGYEEFNLPVIVKEEIMRGTGQLPKFKEDLFKVENEDMYLIPTAEVPLTNWYANQIVDLTDAKKMTAYTTCFRAEAGSGGKDMKGLIRSHQFNKVELVKITSAEKAEAEYQATVNDAKRILELLELPYRELMLCTGDLGFSATKTVDLEVWLPSENKFREISSISLCGDFQARRAAIRYKNKDGKNEYAQTINGSGLAIDRTIAAILENYQNADGTITIPEKLVKYMGVEKI